MWVAFVLVLSQMITHVSQDTGAIRKHVNNASLYQHVVVCCVMSSSSAVIVAATDLDS
jgi:hypothetical protein